MSLWSIRLLHWVLVHQKQMILNCWVKLAVKRVMCLVCTCWLAESGLSLKSRQHFSYCAVHPVVSDTQVFGLKRWLFLTYSCWPCIALPTATEVLQFLFCFSSCKSHFFPLKKKHKKPESHREVLEFVSPKLYEPCVGDNRLSRKIKRQWLPKQFTAYYVYTLVLPSLHLTLLTQKPQCAKWLIAWFQHRAA